MDVSDSLYEVKYAYEEVFKALQRRDYLYKQPSMITLRYVLPHT